MILKTKYLQICVPGAQKQSGGGGGGIFVAIANNTLYGSKLYILLLCQKSLDIKIMFHEDIL